MTLGAESSQSRSHLTTIIQTSPWSVWLPPQCLIESSSHLEPWVPFLTYAPDFSSPYPLDLSLSTPQSWQGIYIQADKIFRLGICRWSTCQGMRLDHPRASPSNEERPVGWTQPDLLPCADVGLVILNDKSLRPACQARWHRPLEVIRDNRTWRMYMSRTVLEWLRAW